MNWVLKGGSQLIEQDMHPADLAITAGVIAEDVAADAQVADVTGLWLLPGIIDLHGDAIERILMPRPGVSFPLPLALAEADRQMLANGITTAYHGLTVGWEPGLRSLSSARAFVTALESMGTGLACDTRINFRWETFALDAVADLVDWFDRMPGAILSLNDHTTANLGQSANSSKIRRMAERTGLSTDECLTQLALVAAHADEVPHAKEQVVAAARAANLVCLAHDENSPEDRVAHGDLGVTVTEFPMTRETARAARDRGEAVIFGAPNVLRGGSQNNAVDAAPAMAEGLGTVLASDYWYPAPLQAAFILAERYGMRFAAAWNCVSAHPADAARLEDRGRLAPGLRADVIAVCPNTRRVKAVWIAGVRKLAFA